jgi:hypothetical protein
VSLAAEFDEAELEGVVVRCAVLEVFLQRPVEGDFERFIAGERGGVSGVALFFFLSGYACL